LNVQASSSSKKKIRKISKGAVSIAEMQIKGIADKRNSR
jgi:hypothetical protein